MVDERFPRLCQQTLVFIFAIFGPLSITQWDKVNALFLISVSLLFSLILLFSNVPKKINRNSMVLISGYFFFTLVGIIKGAGALNTLPGNYVENLVLGRIIMCFFCFVIFINLNVWLHNCQNDKLLIQYLNLALFVLCVFLFFGVWQWLSFITNIPYPFETRSYIHGVSEEIKGALGSRTTSLAREPNYLAPLLFECIILSIALLGGKLRKLVIYIALFVSLTTLSGGVYAHFIILSSFYFIQALHKFKVRTLVLVSSFFLTILIISIPLIADTILGQYVANKFMTESQGGSLRGLIVLELTNIFLYGDWLQLLFGFGLSSLEFSDSFQGAGTYTNVIFSISNITYLDVLFQSGIVGFLFYIVPCFFIFIHLWKNRKFNTWYELALIYFTSVLISGIYRSEYASSHFAWAIVIVMILENLGKREKEKCKLL